MFVIVDPYKHESWWNFEYKECVVFEIIRPTLNFKRDLHFYKSKCWLDNARNNDDGSVWIQVDIMKERSSDNQSDKSLKAVDTIGNYSK